MRYPATPTESVEAVQVRSICVVEVGLAERPVGMVGAVVSGAGGAPVTVTVTDWLELPPLPLHVSV